MIKHFKIEKILEAISGYDIQIEVQGNSIFVVGDTFPYAAKLANNGFIFNKEKLRYERTV